MLVGTVLPLLDQYYLQLHHCFFFYVVFLTLTQGSIEEANVSVKDRGLAFLLLPRKTFGSSLL